MQQSLLFALVTFYPRSKLYCPFVTKSCDLSSSSSLSHDPFKMAASMAVTAWPIVNLRNWFHSFWFSVFSQKGYRFFLPFIWILFCNKRLWWFNKTCILLKGPKTLKLLSTLQGTDRLGARASDPACWLLCLINVTVALMTVLLLWHYLESIAN